MATLSLCGSSSRRAYERFIVEAWRDEDLEDCYLLEGRTNTCEYYAFRTFFVRNQDYASAFHDAVDVCGMLNYLLELKKEGRTESEALQLTAALYPEHFKYLAEFGYESPSEEGGVADGTN